MVLWRKWVGDFELVFRDCGHPVAGTSLPATDEETIQGPTRSADGETSVLAGLSVEHELIVGGRWVFRRGSGPTIPG